MDQIEEVRQKTDIVELISSLIPLKKAGRNFKALCPFHSEKTPSFVVSSERQIFKCFGCSVGGDVYKFLIEYEKMTFAEALRFLADRAGIKLKSFRPSVGHQEREKLMAINHLALEFYHFILLNHQVGKKGLDYLLKRGIRKSSIKLFKLGYAPDSWQSLIDFLGPKKGFKSLDLEKAGLAIKGSKGYYDRFRGRIIFPLADHRSNVLGFSGRTLKPELKEAKYINTPETLVYHKGELFYGLEKTKEFIKKKNEAIICEGETDVISSYQAGVKNVVAIKGSALTQDQVNLIKRFSPTIKMALDADTAGDLAVRRGIEIADLAGLNIRVVQLKYGKDPDECARHSAALWRQSVKKSIPIYDFYIKSALKRLNKSSAEGKKKITEELVPILAKITNEVVKAHYVKKLAGVLDVSEEVVLKEIDRVGRLKKAVFVRPSQAKPSQAPTTRKERLEEFLLSLVLQKGAKSSALVDKVETKFFTNPALKKLTSFLKKYLSQNKYDINKFAKTLPEELIEALDRLYLADLQDVLKEKPRFLREFDKTVRELEKLYLREKLSALAKKIQKLEKAGDEKKIKSWQEKFTLFSKKLKGL